MPMFISHAALQVITRESALSWYSVVLSMLLLILLLLPVLLLLLLGGELNRAGEEEEMEQVRDRIEEARGPTVLHMPLLMKTAMAHSTTRSHSEQRQASHVFRLDFSGFRRRCRPCRCLWACGCCISTNKWASLSS